eukprot:359244-Chlamydomonas_euryale.AAC.2
MSEKRQQSVRKASESVRKEGKGKEQSMRCPRACQRRRQGQASAGVQFVRRCVAACPARLSRRVVARAACVWQSVHPGSDCPWTAGVDACPAGCGSPCTLGLNASPAGSGRLCTVGVDACTAG